MKIYLVFAKRFGTKETGWHSIDLPCVYYRKAEAVEDVKTHTKKKKSNIVSWYVKSFKSVR